MNEPQPKTVAQEIRQTARVVDADSRARTHLANERTFLAWLRTGLSLVALGLAAAQFLGGNVPGEEQMVTVLAALLIVSGALMTVAAGRRFLVARNAIETGTYSSGAVAIALSAALAVATGIIALVVIWYLQTGRGAR